MRAMVLEKQGEPLQLREMPVRVCAQDSMK